MTRIEGTTTVRLSPGNWIALSGVLCMYTLGLLGFYERVIRLETQLADMTAAHTIALSRLHEDIKTLRADIRDVRLHQRRGGDADGR